jgi:serine/threonine-protein kinase
MSSTTEDRVLTPGSVVAGKLRVVRLLGEGGMGAVYEVEHELTKHRRALKVLHPRVAGSPTIVARFLREASAAARIGNPHIAETFDAGRLESGEPYLLMELLEGETLDGRVSRVGPLSPGEIADLVYQACEGIIAAHDAGIVHRDLKPENLFVTTRDGVPFVKVLDFGISKFESRRTGALGVTAEGAVMGTPFYMPPEQVRGSTSIDARADIYSLGVILYECSSGTRPYDAPTLEQLAILIHEGKGPPLSERRPSLPPAFCQVVARAMAVDRDQRYPTARELADALAPFRVPTVTGVRASEPPRVVIRSSAPPASHEVGAAASAFLVPSVTATAMADTMRTDPPPPSSARLRGWALLAGLVILSGVALTVTFAHRPGAPASAGGGVTAVIQPEPPAPGPSVTPVALSPVASLTNPSPDAPDAGPLHGSAPSHPIGPLAKPVVAGATPPPAPTPSPAPKSRVDQSGLAGENPFR